LIKIEESIDKFILNIFEKLKALTPTAVYSFINWIKHIPSSIKKILKAYQPKVKIIGYKIIGYTDHYLTMARGHLIALNFYLKSDEFKNRNKFEMLTDPLKKFKTDPVLAFSVLLIMIFLSSAGFFIYKNTEKIVAGTKALRGPASSQQEEDPILEFKKLKYSVLDKEIFLDVTIIATSLEERNKLTQIEKQIEEHLLGIKIHANQLPLSKEDLQLIKKDFFEKINGAKVKDVEIKQFLEARPKYFMQTEKLFALKDLNLQLFLEDTRRNRQVWVDFTCLTSNRNIILFLKEHQVEIRDYLNMHVEPVIPQLPIEEEGRQIIKEKIKLELNEFLKENEIEGKILEIYIDYLMVS
jgi:hypothetical protein